MPDGKKSAFSVFHLSLVFLLGAVGSGRAQTEPPEFLADSLTFIGEHLFLSIGHTTDQWLQVEVSSDLGTWTELANVRSNRPFFVFPDENASALDRRFYRLRTDAPTVEEARADWRSRRPERYRFRLRRDILIRGESLTATVTVLDGIKTVTDVEINGTPQTEFDPADFPDVEELFDLLAEIESLNTLQTWVQYDPDWGYPLRCHLDYRSVRVEAEDFWINEFEVVPPD